jgi:hypothetical protein
MIFIVILEIDEDYMDGGRNTGYSANVLEILKVGSDSILGNHARKTC